MTALDVPQLLLWLDSIDRELTELEQRFGNVFGDIRRVASLIRAELLHFMPTISSESSSDGSDDDGHDDQGGNDACKKKDGGGDTSGVKKSNLGNKRGPTGGGSSGSSKMARMDI